MARRASATTSLSSPCTNPAAALHQPRLRQDLITDMKKLPAILAEIDQIEEGKDPEPQPQQLSLFLAPARGTPLGMLPDGTGSCGRHTLRLAPGRATVSRMRSGDVQMCTVASRSARVCLFAAGAIVVFALTLACPPPALVQSVANPQAAPLTISSCASSPAE